uniref:C2 domain-containing protein n=1 Tax=Lactuca sativa TaxID=4236 RepID=A0A9R1X1D6_LACSA|nr:hypothetical protein LSAT_V11C700376110 [Lactuca sativa]
MASYGIHGDLLEVTVVSCNKLKDTEWISRQDPYVHIEYGSNKSSTRTCKDGGKNPTFQEKFVYSLVEGLRELNVTVWNSNTITHDDFIGSGKIPLAKVLSQGFDDSSWPLQSKTGRHAGEVRLIMHYSNSNSNSGVSCILKPGKDIAHKPSKGLAPSAPPASMYSAPPPSMYSASPPPHMYSAPPPPSMYSAPPPPAASYPSQGEAYPPPGGAYPPQGGAYPPPSPYSSYPPNSGVYPPAAYPPQAAPYPPPAYSSNSYGSHYPPGSPFPGMYPPPPY